MKYAQIQRFISLLVISGLGIILFRCTSTRILSKSELLDSNAGKYYYVVHSSRQAFKLEKYSKISNDTLSGKIIQISSHINSLRGDEIQLYFTSNYVIKIEKGEFLSVPINAVTKAEIEKFTSGGKASTILIFAGIFFGICILLAITNSGPSISW